MNKHVRTLALSVLSAKKIHATRMTDNNELQSLLNKLKPISCGKDLIRLGPEGDGGILFQMTLQESKHVFHLV
jgi:hypothetical protein